MMRGCQFQFYGLAVRRPPTVCVSLCSFQNYCYDYCLFVGLLYNLFAIVWSAGCWRQKRADKTAKGHRLGVLKWEPERNGTHKDP